MPIDYSAYSGLAITLDGSVLRLVLTNPPLNAMTEQAHSDLAKIWPVIGADPRVRVVVFTGSGDRAFCAGGDLAAMVDHWGDRGRWQIGMAEARAIIVGMLECPKPVIGRINGHAMGLGASLALACDITIAVEDAQIADPHVAVGLATGDGGALLWTHLAGSVAARRHLLSGQPVSGWEAAEMGLVTEVVSREGLDAAVSAWTDRLLASSPSAVQTTKLALNLDLIDKAKRYMDEMLRLETQSWMSENHPEAVRAMLEKRRPSFRDE